MRFLIRMLEKQHLKDERFLVRMLILKKTILDHVWMIGLLVEIVWFLVDKLVSLFRYFIDVRKLEIYLKCPCFTSKLYMLFAK